MDKFMSTWLQLMVDSFKTIFDTLDTIQFFGISLLDLVISCFILSVAIPIVIATANGHISSRETSAIARGASASAKAKAGKALDNQMAKYDDMINDLKDY